MEQKDFLELANQWYNIDLSWLAGTGKTYVLKQFISEQEKLKKNIIIVAPTWVAAINVWWATIHSTFKIFGNEYFRINKQIVTWSNIDILIIDEKSMIWPDLFDHINNIINKYSKWNKIQIILCWDMAQLPPIYKTWWTKEEVTSFELLKKKYWKLIYSSAKSFVGYKEVFLDKIFRQSDERLINVLNNLRDWDITSINELKKWWYTREEEKNSIHLMPYNNMVDSFNDKEFSLVKTKKYHYKWKVSWKFNIDNVLTPVDLYLKNWCRVMLTRNIFDSWLYNWDMWTVISCEKDYVIIDFDRIWEMKIYNITWENREYVWDTSNVIWTFDQIPLRLAYWISIHKSQWLSLSHVIIHYVPWMTKESLYVAVSRAENYDNLYLAK